ncbi:MAG: bifunctional 2-polyprenyl-6-hydroxyphenol methylase/3-demethylubiquinol 3-O-methyltransferase UbiG [Xanthomonadales bacterium]|nr:bifunctional 2-polyprenyl-6-hydroxyphenol methylase/3-demethylubiquinol 3-O-methyltransferase UbiG [Xanthomonadales bacterium]
MTNASSQVLNVDADERAKFEALAARWWDPEGDSRPLHDLNPARQAYVCSRVAVRDQALLDVGCGGGIFSESLAAAGAKVTAIDVAEKALNVARLHLFESQLEVDYRAITVEELAAEQQDATPYRVITCMEMLEHVPEPWSVVQACAELLAPGGHVFFSTLNRTPKAFAVAILGAEYAMGLLPRGTHQYRKFIRPSELSAWCREAGLQVEDISGMHYNPITRDAKTGPGVQVNYLLHATKLA